MKKTYFYSKKQSELLAQHFNDKPGYNPPFSVAPNGKAYTELMLCDGNHISNFDDAIVVFIQYNCIIDKQYFKITGKKIAKL